MPLTAGTKLGPYEVVAPLGAGGMGEVYRARDSRLGREVAVKVLPQHLSASPEVRSRFEREAKTVSSLNHPNICTLFDVGREGDTDFLVMELVEGETLASRLTKGPLPPSEVLKLGAQIADALDRAHRAGVIHRDLKPGNVMLTKSGAKLMDFGLARATGLMAPTGSGASFAMTQSPTMAQPLTAEGTIVGTFQYMAPEQLEGNDADARSDLWGLGCVLYEMATGKRAFEGKSQASLISAIMSSEPAPVAQLAPMSPPALGHLINQCLAKDPDERWQSAGDVRRELQWVAGGSSQIGAPAVARRRGFPRATLAALAGWVVAVGALTYALGPWNSRSSQTPLMRFMIAAPMGQTIGFPAEAELSPDGSMLAFVAIDSGGGPHLYVRSLASPEARLVPGADGGSLPFWSPDNRMLGFFAGGKLRKVALDGSPPLVLCDAPDARGGAWSPGGTIVFAPSNQGPLSRVSAKGGAPTPLTVLDAGRREIGHRYPQFLPDGRHFLFVAIDAGDERSTFAASLDGGAPVEICKGGSVARYVPPGYLLLLDTDLNSPQRRLLARRFDVSRLRTSGDAELVLDRVNSLNFGYSNVTANENGSLVAQHWSDPHARLVWRDRRGVALGTVLDDFEGIVSNTLDPESRRIAYCGPNPLDLFVQDLANGVSTRLTFENRAVTNMIWSPDGRRLAYSRLRGERRWEIFAKLADGTGKDSLVFHGPGLFSYPLSWSRDGRTLLASCSDTLGNYDLWSIPMDGSGAPSVYQSTPSPQEKEGSFSPDGKWVGYVADEGGQQAVYVQSYPDPGTKYQLSVRDPVSARWSAAGDELIVLTKSGVQSVRVSTADGFRQGTATQLFQPRSGDFVVGIDKADQRFLIATVKDASALSSLEIVLGWPQLLEKK